MNYILVLLGLFAFNAYSTPYKNAYSTPYKSDIPDLVETNKKHALKIHGQIPHWLKGSYVRSGPGKFKIGDDSIKHMFDGFAYLTAFKFHKGTITYNAKFLESDQYKSSMASGKLILGNGADCKGEFTSKHKSKDGQNVKTTNPNINVETIGGKFVALGETPLPVEFELESLDTVGIFDYDDTLQKQNGWESAHMKRDPDTQALYNIYIEYGKESFYVLYRIDPASTERKLLVKHPVSQPSYMHDFSITENYIILTAYPLVVNPIDLMNQKNSFFGAHKWKPELQTTVYVFNKETGDLVSELKTDSIFAYHHVNAYEDNKGIIQLMLCASDNADSLQLKGHPILRQITIDIPHSKIDCKILSQKECEMPRLRESLIGKKNQYFYAIQYDPVNHKKGNGLIKYDLDAQKQLLWFKPNMFPEEPIFIENPESSVEDDGVIVSVVHDKKKHRNFLLILDAKTMTELARADIPQLLPHGLHGRLLTRVQGEN